jgi:hypothetical protein
MKDYQACIEKLRKDAAEAALIRDLATDEEKREVFNRLCEHLNRLADEVEQSLRRGQTGTMKGVNGALQGSRRMRAARGLPWEMRDENASGLRARPAAQAPAAPSPC